MTANPFWPSPPLKNDDCHQPDRTNFSPHGRLKNRRARSHIGDGVDDATNATMTVVEENPSASL